MPIKPPAKLTNSAVCARLRSSVLLWTAASSFRGLRMSSGIVTGTKEMRFPNSPGRVAAAQIDRNHHAEHSSLHAIAMQFEISPYGCGHQRKNDVVHAGPAGVPYCFDFRQRNFSPSEFLWPAVENVEAEPSCGHGEFRKQTGELNGGDAPAICRGAFRHARYVRQRGQNSFDEFRIGVEAPGRDRNQEVTRRWNLEAEVFVSADEALRGSYPSLHS